MYTLFLQVHGWLGWLVLFLGLVVVLRCSFGWLAGRVYRPWDNKTQVWYIAVLHVQFILGVLLYVVLSPKTQAIFKGITGWMQQSELRFLALEHPLIMIVAIVIAQVGRIRSKKVQDDTRKFRMAALAYALSLVLIMSRIPWKALL